MFADQIKLAFITSQIIQLENRIEELRLETIPDVDAIRNLQSAIEKARLELAKLSADEVIVAPI